MSDTNSKGGKKDTDKIQFIKVGSESFSQIFTKKKKDEARKEPSDFHTRVEMPPETPDSNQPLLDEVETGLSAEMQIERLATESPMKLDLDYDPLNGLPKEPSIQNELEPIVAPEPLVPQPPPPAPTFSQPVNPVNNDQLELLRKYVTLKETEIRDLRDQQKQYQAFIKKVSSQLEHLTTQNREYLNDLESIKQRELAAKREIEKLREKHESEISVLRSHYDEKIEKLGAVKHQASELEHKQEAWQEKVKDDLKRIKLKEKELENKYELLRRDTQALLDSKDRHVLELKKKNDALDFELEGFEDKLRKANSILAAVESKKNKVLETLRLITSLIESLNAETVDFDEDRKAG